jgi:hypothetical protein
MATPFEDFVNAELPTRVSTPVPGGGNLTAGNGLVASGTGLGMAERDPWTFTPAAGTYSTAYGSGNNVYGNYSLTFGYNNTIYSGAEHCFVAGDSNLVYTGGTLYAAAFGKENVVGNFGDYTFTAGYSNANTNRASVCFGDNSTVQGDRCIVAGKYNWIRNTASHCSMFGRNNYIGTAGPGHHVSGGYNRIENTSTGYSFIHGKSNKIYGDYSVALGRDNTIYENDSFAVGYGNILDAYADSNFAFGYWNTTSSTANTSFAFGRSNLVGESTVAWLNFALGYGNAVDGYNNLAQGKDNTILGVGYGADFNVVFGKTNTTQQYGGSPPNTNYNFTVGKSNSIQNANYSFFGGLSNITTGAAVVTASGGRTLTFNEAGVNDTITASSGNFNTDGFKISQTLTVTGTTSNNGTFTIDGVTATVITLNAADDLTAEGPLSSAATLTAPHTHKFNFMHGSGNRALYGNTNYTTAFGKDNDFYEATHGFAHGFNNTLGQRTKYSSVWGKSNTVFADAYYAHIRGRSNVVRDNQSVVFGALNDVSDPYCAVFGKSNTVTSGGYSFVAGIGHTVNEPTFDLGLLVVGNNNAVTGTESLTFGGYNQSYSNSGNFVGGWSNVANGGTYATILGGYYNTMEASHGNTIIGTRNEIRTSGARTLAISGGNAANTYSQAIGTNNFLQGTKFSLAQGRANSIYGDHSVATGNYNTIYSDLSHVFGYGNTVDGWNNFVAGHNNTIPTGSYTARMFGAYNDVATYCWQGFALGNQNVIDGNMPVAWGYYNDAYANYSFAFGRGNFVGGNVSYGMVFGKSNLLRGDTGSIHNTAIGLSNTTSNIIVTASGGRTLTFAEAGANDTITASSGSFITDGFLAGQTITVTGTTSNNGVFTINAGGVTATVLTLSGSDDLADEGPLSSAATLTVALMHKFNFMQGSGNSINTYSTSYSRAFGKDNTVGLKYSSAHGENNSITGVGDSYTSGINVFGRDNVWAQGSSFGGTGFVAGYDNHVYTSAAFILGGSNYANSGSSSYIMGLGNQTDTGNWGFAFGYYNTNSSNYSLAFGKYSTIGANEEASAVFGYNNSATGSLGYSIVAGRNHLVTAGLNAVFGSAQRVYVAGGLASGFGHLITASSHNATALGWGNTIQGSSGYSLAAGRQNKLDGSDYGIVFGRYNDVYANYSSILGGYGNTVSSALAMAFGYNNTVTSHTGGAGFAIGGANYVDAWMGFTVGYDNTVSSGAYNAFALGYSSYIGDANYGIALGNRCTVDADYGFAVGSYAHSTRANQVTFGSDRGVLGAAQESKFSRYLRTTDATQASLITLTLDEDKTYSLRIRVAVRGDTTNGKDGSFFLDQAVARRPTAGSASLVGAPTFTEVSDGTLDASVATIIDASGNDIRVRITGDATEPYVWIGTIEFQEVKGT